MNKYPLSKLLIGLLLLTAFASYGFAQAAQTTPANANKAEIIPAETTAANENNAANNPAEATRANDSLPFMQNGETPREASAEPGAGGLLARSLGALLLVVGLIFGGAWALKRSGFGAAKNLAGGAAELAVVSSVSLGANRTLAVVKFGERVLLVGSTAHNFTLLGEQSAEEREELSTPVNARSVADVLAEEETRLSFAKDFVSARKRMNFYEDTGGELR